MPLKRGAGGRGRHHSAQERKTPLGPHRGVMGGHQARPRDDAGLRGVPGEDDPGQGHSQGREEARQPHLFRDEAQPAVCQLRGRIERCPVARTDFFKGRILVQFCGSEVRFLQLVLPSFVN